MSEREVMYAYLTEEIGIEGEEAKQMLVDDDLWLVHPELRYGIEPDEEVRVWKEAVKKMSAMYSTALHEDLYGNVAVTQCLADGLTRAEVKLVRARERARRG
jgi:hypothetical protein